MRATGGRWLTVAVGLAVTASAFAADYYVDSSAGDDSAAGTLADKAWKTIAKVNKAKFQPGDSILFKRGGVWREQLMPPSPGTKERPITFAGYGQGARPIILGSIDKTGEGNWTQEGERLWYVSDVDWRQNFFKIRQGMIWHDGMGGQQKPKKEEMKADWDWYIDTLNKRAYVYLDHNPGRHKIEVQQHPGSGEGSVGFTGTPFITIRDFEIAFTDIGIGLWQAEGWVIENCFIHDVVADAIHINGSADKPPHDNIIRNCQFRDWNWKGYNLTQHNWKEWGKSEPFMGYGVHVFRGQDHQVVGCTFAFEKNYSGMDSSPIAFDDGGHASLIADNYVDGAKRIFGPSTGIMLWATKGTTPVVIRNNYFKDLGGLGIIAQDFGRYKFAQPVTIERNVLVNTCWGDSLDHEAIRVWTQTAAPVTVRNNVVYGVPKGQNAHHGIRVRQTPAVTIENNTVIGADRGISIENKSAATIRNNIATANREAACMVEGGCTVSESGNCWDGRTAGFKPDSSDIGGDPKLSAPEKGDFSPALGSPAAGKGADARKVAKAAAAGAKP